MIYYKSVYNKSIKYRKVTCLKVIALLEDVIRERKRCQRNILKSSSLHLGQPAMLAFVKENPGCSQKQMADAAQVTPACVAASFKRMERAGLIMRREDTADSRCNRVYITQAGERELNYCQEALETTDQRLLSCLTQEETEQLEYLLQKICAGFVSMQKK